MGHQVVKQPDGKYAVWSTIVDDFIFLGLDDLTPYIRYCIGQDVERTINRVNHIKEVLDNGENYYGPHQSSWKDLLDLHRKNHGCGSETLEWVRQNIEDGSP